jgi:hypothetical protein
MICCNCVYWNPLEHAFGGIDASWEELMGLNSFGDSLGNVELVK